jgi:membrane fusion protein (multidrug efflux system)
MKKQILLLSFIIFTSCKSKPKEDKSKLNALPAPTAVEVVIAIKKSVTNNIEVNGTVLANEQLEIHPEISGKLMYLNIPEGTSVSAGAVLAKINDADLQAQLNKSKIQLDLASKTEQRLKKLLSINGINQADYDIALNAVNNIKADIEITKAQIDKTIITNVSSFNKSINQVNNYDVWYRFITYAKIIHPVLFNTITPFPTAENKYLE